jgi:hypothetical protein
MTTATTIPLTSTTIPDTTPPVLIVTYPASGQTLSHRLVEFEGSTEPGCTVLAAGRYPVDVASDGSWAVVLVLNPGGNVAVFEAMDAAGNRTEARVPVNYTPVLPGWTRSATAWPDLRPGCCGGPDVTPVSPIDPWPGTGWPTDGFYPVWPSAAAWDAPDYRSPIPAAVASYELTIGRWIGAGGLIDDTAPTMQRTLPLDENLTVVLRPMEWADASPEALVGDGRAFRHLLADLHDSYLIWFADCDEFSGEEMAALTADPNYPFLDPPGVYRGPDRSLISPGIRWWFALEIRAGEPILYLHAGFIAG